MRKDWKISKEDIERVRPELAAFFKVMQSPKLEEIGIEKFTPKDEEGWAVRRAVSRKIYLTVKWFQAREIIMTVIAVAITLWILLPIDMVFAILFTVVLAAALYFLAYISRPSWFPRLYHDYGMYRQSLWSEAVYGEIEPLSIGESMIRPKPAWITQFIN